MEEFKPNSHKFKEEQKESSENRKKVNKVVTGVAKPRKRSELTKFADVFISEDAANVKSYILMDVLVPAIKKAISDIVTNGIDMILYGETGHTKKNSNTSKVSYSKYYKDRDDDRRPSRDTSARSRFDYDDIVFENRGDAEAVLDQMYELIDRYNVVSILDLYDMADLTPPPYTSKRYGWTSLRGAEALRTRDGGYILKLPRPMPID